MKKTKAFPQIKYPEIQCGVYGGNVHSEILGKQVLETFEPNQVFLAGQLYRKQLSETITESAFYKTIERMCKAGTLSKVAKGTYCKPKQGKFGTLPPSENDIVIAFTENQTGMTIGYSLYNSLMITTQIGKYIDVLTSCIEQKQKTIGHIRPTQCSLEYENETKSHLQMLEVLRNYQEIQDLNQKRFVEYASAFAKGYNEDVFEFAYRIRNYPERGISWIKSLSIKFVQLQTS